MSKVRVCDRCGKRLMGNRDGLKMLISGYKYRYFHLETETYDDYGDYDLCAQCMNNFKEFLKGPSEGSTTEATDE